MPRKLMNAIPISPVIINVMPMPLSGAGTLEYCIFSRMAAMPTMARSQPIPEPAPYTIDVQADPRSRCCIKSEAPRMAQFTAIRGKNIPNEA